MRQMTGTLTGQECLHPKRRLATEEYEPFKSPYIANTPSNATNTTDINDTITVGDNVKTLILLVWVHFKALYKYFLEYTNVSISIFYMYITFLSGLQLVLILLFYHLADI